MHTDVPNHEPALLQMHTGNLQPIRPSLGSWLLYGLGTENENLPGYVVLRPSPKIVVGPALWSNSFLPAEYQATSVITADMQVDKLARQHPQPAPRARRAARATRPARRSSTAAISRSATAMPSSKAQIRAMETAFHMQREAMETFDISREPRAGPRGVRRHAVRALLPARAAAARGRRALRHRLLHEHRQPAVGHARDHNERHPKLCADGDRAAAALIADLKQRGLLDDTLVIWGGEFGRTPYAENKGDKKQGRPRPSSHRLLHAARRRRRPGGLAYGATDELGMNAAENPVHVHDLHATILHLLGLDHERLTYRYAGRDFRLTDVHGRVVRDIMA